MKKILFLLLLSFAIIFLSSRQGFAQCSICTKTASQLGEQAGKGLNSGILYLMFTPLAIAGFLGFRWWKQEKMIIENEETN